MLLDPLRALGLQEWLLCNRSKQKYLSLSWLSSPAHCLKLEKYGIHSTRLTRMNTHALVTEGSSVLVCGHRRWTGIQLFVWFPFCTSPSIIIYDPHTCGLAIKGKSRACPSQTAQPDVSKGFVGANSSAAWLPRSGISELAQRGSAQKGLELLGTCLLFFSKGWAGCMCEKFGIVLFNPGISSGNIYIQMQGLIFVGEGLLRHGMLIPFSVGSGSDSQHAGVGHTKAFSINTWSWLWRWKSGLTKSTVFSRKKNVTFVSFVLPFVCVCEDEIFFFFFLPREVISILL